MSSKINSIFPVKFFLHFMMRWSRYKIDKSFSVCKLNNLRGIDNVVFQKGKKVEERGVCNALSISNTDRALRAFGVSAVVWV